MTLRIAAAALLLVTSLTPGFVAAAPPKEKKAYDPDEMICVVRAVTGSRLQRERVCYTAREWEDVKMQEKVGLSRKQFNSASSAPPTRDSPW